MLVRRSLPVIALPGLLLLSACNTEGRGPAEPVRGAPAEGSPRLRVDPSGSGDHTTIGAALAAAPDGALVEIAAGTYRERLVLERPVTLVGAGIDGTRIIAAPVEGAHAPVVTITSAHPDRVTLRDLAITLEGEGRANAVGRGGAVHLASAVATLDGVAVLGSPACGVTVEGGDVELRSMLVAGAWATGVAIRQGPSAENPSEEHPSAQGSISLVDSEVRNCRHRGVTVGGPAPRVRIEGCLISGSSWHGIRYDDASPTIVGNVIRDNMRSGIYASGETGATVEENLFVGTGISSWKRGQDTIRRNTFVVPSEPTAFVSSRAGVAVIGGSDPLIENNLFVSDSASLLIGRSSDDDDDGAPVEAGSARASGNVTAGAAAWLENGEILVPEGGAPNRRVDRAEVVLVDGLPRVEGSDAGASGPLPMESRWPEERPEERPVASLREDELEAKRAQREAMALVAPARAQAEAWTADLMQIRDAELRDRTAAEVLEALEGAAGPSRYAALLALQGSYEAKIERAPFEDPARRVARTGTGTERVSAFYVLNMCGREEGDLDLLIESLEERGDRALEGSALHLLTMYSGGELVGDAGRAAYALLDQPHAGRRVQLNGLWGARVSEDIEGWLLERHAASDFERSHDALYFGLSTLRDKSPAVVEALFRACEDPNPNNSGRALWGLTHGVGEESQERVATFLLDLFEARAAANVRDEALGGVRTYGTEAHLERLEALAANELVSERHRQAAARAIDAIRARAGD